MKMAGVYIIQSKSNSARVYVGSASDIKGRWDFHMKQLLAGKHHSKKLQRHFNKYGKYDLIFDVLESGCYLCKQHLLSREQGWFTHFEYKRRELPFFNNEPIAGSSLGVKRSKETCCRIGDSKRGIPSPNKGKKYGKAPSTAFPKGNIPWNKGHGEYTKGMGAYPIIQLDSNGVVIKEWASADSISSELNLSVHYVRRRCNGYFRRRGKDVFYFIYKKDFCK
jgi:group I intron endonuclease